MFKKNAKILEISICVESEGLPLYERSTAFYEMREERPNIVSVDGLGVKVRQFACVHSNALLVVEYKVNLLE